MKQAAWLKGMRVLVVGLGVTGRACARALAPLGAEVTVTDTRADLSAFAQAIKAVETAGARFMPSAQAAGADPQLIVLSPGLPPEHALVQRFTRRGVPVMSEIELAFRLADGVFAGLTGTNGKTTVAGLTGHILGAKFQDVRVVGNIGDPLIEAVADSNGDTVFVTELSSYQLELCDTLRPRVAMILNVQPDHLERHGTMDAYAAAKRRLIEKQEAGDTAVLNRDDPRVRAMAACTAADVLFVSTLEEVERGAFMRKGALTARLGNADTELCHESDMLLKGEHNHSNALHAALCGLVLGVPAADVAERLCSFRGFPHRIQTVAVKNGVEFVDDSKATNPDAALAAMRAFKGRPMVLILGGDDKGLDYTEFYKAVRAAATHAVIVGPGLRRMAGELRAAGFDAVRVADTMNEAVRTAAGLAEPGGVVLLSPASSSFDLFKNYEERGRVFTDAVHAL